MNPCVLIVGNFLSASGRVHSVGEDLALRLGRCGWRVLTTSSRVNRMWRLADMLASTWNHRNRFHVAHVDVYSGAAFLWAEAVGRMLQRLRKPYILTLRGGNLPDFSKARAQRVRRLLGSASAVTVPSAYLQRDMSDYCSQLHLIRNPVDLGAYEFRLREQPKPHLLWLRSFHKMYNPMLAPQVVAKLKDRFSDVRMTMIGPDRGDGSLNATQQVCRELGVSDRVTIVPGVPKSEVPEYLKRGDILLNTTNYDNTPVSLIEASACGLCIVSTDVGGIPKLFERDREALLVAPKDVEGMAAAVERLLNQPALAAQLSRNARLLAHEHDWGTVLPQWQALLSEAVDKAAHA